MLCISSVPGSIYLLIHINWHFSPSLLGSSSLDQRTPSQIKWLHVQSSLAIEARTFETGKSTTIKMVVGGPTDLEGGLKIWTESQVQCSQCKVVLLIFMRFGPSSGFGVHLSCWLSICTFAHTCMQI